MNNVEYFMAGLKKLEKETGLTIVSCCFNRCHIVEIGDPQGQLPGHSKATFVSDIVEGAVLE